MHKFLLDGIHRAKMQSFKLSAGITVIKLITIPKAYGDTYEIDLITTSNNITSHCKLADGKQVNKSNARKIERLMDYMKNEKSLFKPGYEEKEPQLYQVIIFK